MDSETLGHQWHRVSYLVNDRSEYDTIPSTLVGGGQIANPLIIMNPIVESLPRKWISPLFTLSIPPQKQWHQNPVRIPGPVYSAWVVSPLSAALPSDAWIHGVISPYLDRVKHRSVLLSSTGLHASGSHAEMLSSKYLLQVLYSRIHTLMFMSNTFGQIPLELQKSQV